MSRGFLMFAYNNESIDYVSLALCNALLIKKNLTNNKVALVTNQGSLDYLSSMHGELIDTAFDKIILDDITDYRVSDRTFFDTRYTRFSDRYYNLNRVYAYDLTPWRETILLDVDYLMLDSTMDLVWGCQEELLCNRKTITLDHSVNSFGFDNRFNQMSIPLYWATALYFKKTQKAQALFELIDFIKENYEYYRYLYGFQTSGYFRNDFALSIAIHMIDNLMEYNSIKPMPVNHIFISTHDDEMHDFADGSCIITSEHEQGDFKLHRVSSNVHMMNKRAVLRHKEKIIKHAIS